MHTRTLHSLLCLVVAAALCWPTPAFADEEPSEREPSRTFSTISGAAGGVHVVDAQSGEAGSVRVQLGFDYFRGSDFLVLGDTNESLGGTLSVAVAAADYLELFGTFQTRGNSNSLGEPVLIQIVGDTLLGVKGHTELRPWLGLGADLRVALLNNVGDLGIAGDATSFGLRADATADLRRIDSPLPLIFRSNLDYYFDNSGALVSGVEEARYRALAPSTRRARINEDRHLISRIERLSLGVNRVDMLTFGLGAEAQLSPVEQWFVHPLVEWQIGVPVNRQGYNCLSVASSGEIGGEDGCLAVQGMSAAPSILSLGFRLVPPVRGLSFLFDFDIGLRGSSDFVRELAPTRPWALLFAIAFDSGTGRAAPAERVKARAPDEAVWAAGSPVARARVRGIAVDKESGAPIADVAVRYPDPNLSAQLTSVDGEFTSYELDPGEARFEFSHPDYETRTCVAVLAKVDEAAPAAAARPSTGPFKSDLAPVAADSPDGAAAGTRASPVTPRADDNPLLVPLRCELTARSRVGSLRGSVHGAGKAPLAGVNVVLTGPVGHTVTSDASGGFASGDLPIGEYGVAVDAPGYLPLRQSLRIERAAEASLDLVLTEAPKPDPSKPAQVVLTAHEVRIKKQILFMSKSAEIDERSLPLIAEIAAVLNANPQVKRVQVQGHTDNKGNRDKNQRLSQARAESVVRALVDRGVASERLEAKGFGDTRPLVPNLTDGNRAQNRRVQLLIVEQ